MPRELSYIHKEIVRTADYLELPDPLCMTRKTFLKAHDDDGRKLHKVTKHDLHYYGGYAKVRTDAMHTLGVEKSRDVVAARGVELRNNYYRKIERKLATQDYLGDKLRDSISQVFSDNPIDMAPGLDPEFEEQEYFRNITILWSDLHFGLRVRPDEVLGAEFTWNIAARRLAKTCFEAARWNTDNTKLTVVLDGDILHGVIHLSESNIAPITMQVFGAMQILTNALSYLRQNFPYVHVVCLPGNHDRTTYRGGGRHVAERWDNHATSIYLGLYQAFRTDENITFDIPMSGIGQFHPCDDQLIIAAHGDTKPTTGNVGKSLNTEGITYSIYKMTEPGALPKTPDVCLFGHWHTPSVFMLPTGTVVIVNGCLIGAEPFGQNGVGFFNGMPAQIMFESTPDAAVASSSIIQLRDADEEPEYDKVIAPPRLRNGNSLV